MTPNMLQVLDYVRAHAGPDRWINGWELFCELQEIDTEEDIIAAGNELHRLGLLQQEDRDHDCGSFAWNLRRCD